jgi:hypothetical protein
MDYPGIYVRWLAVQHAIQDDGQFVGREKLASICEPNVPEVLVFPKAKRTTATKNEILSRLESVLDEHEGEFVEELETRVRCGTMDRLQERYKVVEQNGKVLQCLCMHGSLCGQWLYPLRRILEHQMSEGMMRYRVRWTGYAPNDEWDSRWIQQDELFGQADVIAEYWKEYWLCNGIRSVVAVGPVIGHTGLKDGSLWYLIRKGANREEAWVIEAMIDQQKELLVEYHNSLPATTRQVLERFISHPEYRSHIQEPRKDYDGDVTPAISGQSSGDRSTNQTPYPEQTSQPCKPVQKSCSAAASKPCKLVPKCANSDSSGVNDSDFTHLGTSFHSFEETVKQFSVKTGPQVCEI